jgi:hypothetical protein
MRRRVPIVDGEAGTGSGQRGRHRKWTVRREPKVREGEKKGTDSER